MTPEQQISILIAYLQQKMRLAAMQTSISPFQQQQNRKNKEALSRIAAGFAASVVKLHSSQTKEEDEKIWSLCRRLESDGHHVEYKQKYRFIL